MKNLPVSGGILIKIAVGIYLNFTYMATLTFAVFGGKKGGKRDTFL